MSTLMVPQPAPPLPSQAPAEATVLSLLPPSASLEIPPSLFRPSSEGIEEGIPLLRVPGGTAVGIGPLPSSGDGGSRRRCLLLGRRRASADVIVDHGSVSRVHAALFYVDENVRNVDGPGGDVKHSPLFLLDNNTKHGTHLNGTRLEKGSSARVRDGSTVRLGRSSVKMTVSFPTLNLKGSGTAPEKNVPPPHNSKEVPCETREQRESAIAAAVASLDSAPTYIKAKIPDVPSTVDELWSRDRDDDGKASSTANANDLSSSTGYRRRRCHTALPLERTVTMPRRTGRGGRTAPVTSLSFDPAGSRLASSGGSAGDVRSVALHDFGGMDGRFMPFRTLDLHAGEEGSRSVVEVSWSRAGDGFAVATAGCQPVVFDRDGNHVITFARGDAYAMDPARTAGHCASATSAASHPSDRHALATSSRDGTVRLWNLGPRGKYTFDCLKCDEGRSIRIKNKGGRRTVATCVSWRPDGCEVAVGTSCGSVQAWECVPNTGKAPNRPATAKWEHQGEVTCALYSSNGTKIASRARGDDRVLVWGRDGDLGGGLKGNLKLLHTYRGVPCENDGANLAWDPDGRHVAVGGAVSPKEEHAGTLRIYDTQRNSSDDEDIKPAAEVGLGGGEPRTYMTRILWHPRLNQIFCGLNNGDIQVFYDPKLSTNGVILCISRAIKRPDALVALLRSNPNSTAPVGPVLAPHALPMYRVERNTKRHRDENRADPVRSKKPQPPANGPMIGASSGTGTMQTVAGLNFTQFVVSNTTKNKLYAGRDPREELFKYAEGKSYVDHAYDKKVYADKTAEEEEEDMKKK